MRFTIRHRLLLLSIALLSLPLVGLQYLRETERFLQTSLETALTGLASAVAYSLRNSPVSFKGDGGLLAAPEPGNLFVHPLAHAVQIDGYVDDWISYLDWSTQYGNDRADAATDVAFRVLLGRHDQQVYGLLDVTDDRVTYQQQASEWPVRADTVELVYADADGILQRVYLSTSAPGAVTAYQVIEKWDFSTERRPVTHIRAEWQETAHGYHLEFRVPGWLFGARLGVVVHDVDDVATPARSVGTAGPATAAQPGLLVRTSTELEDAVMRLRLSRGQRVWILDRHGQVLASGGSLDRPAGADRLNFLYALLLPDPPSGFEDDLAGASRLYGVEVAGALAGREGTRWRSSPDQRAVIVSAAHPVTVRDEVVGAVVIEETTGRIQTLQRRAMANLFTVSLLTYLTVTTLFIVFASRIAWRLDRLARDSDAAIDSYGRVVGELTPGTASDEIGDVSRHLAGMLRRLSEYHRYLESLAAKLVHELRTPIAIVKSSLDNLAEQPIAPAASDALQRAREGTDRLSELVLRLSEARRLEQAIQAAEREPVDLAALVQRMVESYRAAYPARSFVVAVPPAPVVLDLAPELIAQMLDKLVGNAVEFSTPGSAIRLSLAVPAGGAQLQIVNVGPELPAAMAGQLFDSMVSIRTQRDSATIHLGLGLYIVRLVMEYHGGSATARNLDDHSGVCITLAFPAVVTAAS